MEKYESNVEQINRPAVEVYPLLSDFTRFTPVVGDKVENWQATENECSFSAKGFTMELRIVEKRANDLVKIETTEASPLQFTAWIQLIEAGERDTRMRLTLHIELNMMLKMMLGSKLKDGVNQLASKIAEALNR